MEAEIWYDTSKVHVDNLTWFFLLNNHNDKYIKERYGNDDERLLQRHLRDTWGDEWGNKNQDDI